MRRGQAGVFDAIGAPMIAVYRDAAGWSVRSLGKAVGSYSTLAEAMADAYAADWSANHGEVSAGRDGAGDDG